MKTFITMICILEPDVISVVSKDVIKPEQIYIPSIENFNSSPATHLSTTFLDINEISKELYLNVRFN